LSVQLLSYSAATNLSNMTTNLKSANIIISYEFALSVTVDSYFLTLHVLYLLYDVYTCVPVLRTGMQNRIPVRNTGTHV